MDVRENIRRNFRDAARGIARDHVREKFKRMSRNIFGRMLGRTLEAMPRTRSGRMFGERLAQTKEHQHEATRKARLAKRSAHGVPNKSVNEISSNKSLKETPTQEAMRAPTGAPTAALRKTHAGNNSGAPTEAPTRASQEHNQKGNSGASTKAPAGPRNRWSPGPVQDTPESAPETPTVLAPKISAPTPWTPEFPSRPQGTQNRPWEPEPAPGARDRSWRPRNKPPKTQEPFPGRVGPAPGTPEPL